MNNIHILDCTLRDGGYCNDWRFGSDNILKITKGLLNAGIDIVECGFLTDLVQFDPSVTKFTKIDQLTNIIPKEREGKLFVVMLNFGEYDIKYLPYYNGNSVDGIRVAFHKKNLTDALKLCQEIKRKGYKVFIQPMVSLSYEDEEFLALIKEANQIKPYAFYIVDSFGMMKAKDLTRLFYEVEHNLDEDIWIGFHGHNNMQLAYSNAQQLTQIQTNRNLIIDSSIYGMGRGAGNLNTELFIEYLSENSGKQYVIKPIMMIIDEVINNFYLQNYWGYSLPNYISAAHSAHPNYANYLDDKRTLTIDAMNEIFDMMDSDKKLTFDKKYVEDLYLRYMTNERAKKIHRGELHKQFKDKIVLLIAPGKSSEDEVNKIKSFVTDDVIVVSINFVYDLVEPNFIFVSNLRRYRELDQAKRNLCIVTSNIPSDNVYYQTEYRDLLNTEASVKDNAGLMAIKFFMNFDIKSIYLAGFDGYSHDFKDNYGNTDLAFITKSSMLDSINEGMTTVIQMFSQKIKIQFLTTPKHLIVNRV